MLYYASSIINDYFFKGDQSYTKVPELYVFYVSETDIWHMGKTVYSVRKFLEDLDKPYNDGLHMCYINAEINDNSDIAKLMQYFKTADPKDNSQGRLSMRIQTIKNPKEVSSIMDDLLKEYCDIAKKIALADGRANGEIKEKFATAKRLLAMKLSIQDIAKATTLPVVKIQELQSEMLHTTV